MGEFIGERVKRFLRLEEAFLFGFLSTEVKIFPRGRVAHTVVAVSARRGVHTYASYPSCACFSQPFGKWGKHCGVIPHTSLPLQLVICSTPAQYNMYYVATWLVMTRRQIKPVMAALHITYARVELHLWRVNIWSITYHHFCFELCTFYPQLKEWLPHIQRKSNKGGLLLQELSSIRPDSH